MRRGVWGWQEKGGDGGAGGDVEAASTEELNSKITTLEKEKNKEEEYRNYMQLERVRLSHSRHTQYQEV
jgi:GTPase involved in cell partitioning and DNA repair